jgi:REP element-mobilizing transposase RayT
MDREELFGPRRSIRLPGYHYAETGAYFLTICAYRKECVFGRVRDNGVELTRMGEMVAECWAELPQHFPHVEIPVHVVMPNHFHGIVVLHKGRNRNRDRAEAFQKPMAGSVATLVRCLKAEVTRRANRAGRELGHPVWKRNYFERVLRDGQEYSAASRYTAENPMRWEFDEENPQRRDP